MADPVDPNPSSPDESQNKPGPTRFRRITSRVVDVLLWGAVLAVLGLAFYPKDSGPKVGGVATVHALPVVGTGEVRTIPGKLERPLLIKAFASWCGACRRNNGLLSDLKAAERDGKLDVIAVSMDDSAQEALGAKNSWPIPVDVLHDASGAFARDYKVALLPTYILIGTDGNIQRVTTGTAGASDIRAWLDAAD